MNYKSLRRVTAIALIYILVSSDLLPFLSINHAFGLQGRDEVVEPVPVDKDGLTHMETQKISLLPAETEGGTPVDANGSSDSPVASFVQETMVFETNATNLIGDGANGHTQLMAIEGETNPRVVSKAKSGLGNGDSTNAAVSRKSNAIVFQTTASNLGNDNGAWDIVAVTTGEVQSLNIISTAHNGTAANGASQHPVVSDNGQKIVYQSEATNLVSDDTNGKTDIFVYDGTNDTTTRVSVSDAGAETNADAFMPAISGDGRYVAYWSTATNLVDSVNSGDYHLFVRDLTANVTTVIDPENVNLSATETPDQISISRDGSVIGSTAQPAMETNTQAFIYVKEEEQAHWLSKVKRLSETFTFGNADSRDVYISPDAGMAAFVSEATNLSEKANGQAQVYFYDLETDQIQLASINKEGALGNGASFSPSTYLMNGLLTVLYSSDASNLVEQDGNSTRDIFASLYSVEDGGVDAGDGDTEAPTWSEGAAVELVDAGMYDLTVSWTPINDPGISNYEIVISNDDQSRSIPVPVNETERTIWDLRSGTDYTIEIYAYGETVGRTQIPLTMQASTVMDEEAPTWPVSATAQVVEVDATSIKISWTAAEDDIGVGWYRIEVLDETEYPISYEFVNRDEGLKTEATIHGLSSMSNYSFVIHAFDDMERSTASPLTLNASTINDGTVPTWPENPELTVESIEAGSLSFSWPEAKDDTNVTYLWKIYKDDSHEWSGETEETSITVDDLEPKQTYEMQVVAVDDKRQESDPLAVTETTSADTEAPTWASESTLDTNALSSESILMEWPTANDNLKYNFPDYHLYVNDALEATTNGETSYRITDLTPNTAYNFKVIAFDESGNESVPLTVTETTRGVPQPNSLTWESTETSITLEWDEPRYEDVDAYRVYRDGNFLEEVASTSFTETGLTSFTPYEYQIRSVKDEIESNSVEIITRTESLFRTVRVSTTKDGTELDDDSYNPVFSSDGRYVVFFSYENITNNENFEYDAFYRRDLHTGAVEMVSIDELGIPFEDVDYEVSMDISADGRYVSFYNYDDEYYIYMRDFNEQKTYKLPVPAGTEVAYNSHVSISDDGRYVTFMAENENNEDVIYLYDRDEDTFTLVSDTYDGSAVDDDSSHPVISGDGKFIVFHSEANNLVADDDNEENDIFLYTVGNESEASSLVRVSAGLDGYNENPTISNDGSVIAFISNADVPQISTNYYVEARVFTYDVDSGNINRIDTPAFKYVEHVEEVRPSLNADGSIVAFPAIAQSDEITGSQIFIYDRSNGMAEMVSISSNRIPADDDDDPIVSLRGDGMAIAYSEEATNLVNDDNNYYSDIFVTYFGKDVDTQTPQWTQLAKASTKNIGPAQVTVSWSGIETGDSLYYYDIYQDGVGRVGRTNAQNNTFTVKGLEPETAYKFRVEAVDTYGNISNGGPNVNVKTITKIAEPANFHVQKLYDEGLLLTWGDPLNGEQEEVELYRDGTLIESPTVIEGENVFSVYEQALQAETTYEYELLVKDTHGNESEKASLSVTTLAANAGLVTARISYLAGEEIAAEVEDADVSADGRYVVFESEGESLFDALGISYETVYRQIFLLDRQEGIITPISVNSGVVGNDDSYSPSISGDGNRIVYHSGATNLTDESSNDDHIYLYDRTNHTTTNISKNSDGELGNDDSSSATISQDGSIVVFSSESNNLTEKSSRHGYDVYAYRVDSKQLTQITGGETLDDGDYRGYGDAYDANVSANGQYVVYRILFDTYSYRVPYAEHLYVHNRETGETEQFTYEPSGHSWNWPLYNEKPSISNDGSKIVFESPEYYVGMNHWLDTQIYMYDRNTKTIELLTTTPDGSSPSGGDSSDPQISPDGRFVVFSSTANDLVPGDENEKEDVFIKDLETGKVTLLSKGPNGQQGDGDSEFPVYASETNAVIYQSEATNLVNTDNNDVTDLFTVRLDNSSPTWKDEAELEVVRTGQTLVTLKWPQADDDTDIVTYRVLQDGKVVKELPQDTDQISVNGLEPGETYEFEIQAFDEAGNWSTTGLKATVTTVISGEAMLITNALSSSEIELIWENPGSGVASSYHVLRGLNPDSLEVIATIDDPVQSSYKDSSLSAETTYYYAIEAVNASGQLTIFTDIKEVTTQELAINTIDWSAEQTYPHLVGILGTTVPVEVTGDPGMNAELTIHYLEFPDVSDEEEPQPKEIKIDLTEDDAVPGHYSAQFKLEEGMTKVLSLEVTIADGEGHESRKSEEIGLELTATLDLNVQISQLSDAKIILWSESRTSGKTLTINSWGDYTIDEIIPADDYNLRILDQTDNRTLYEKTLDIKSGMANTHEAEAGAPAFFINLDVVDHEGDPYSKEIMFYIDDEFVDYERINEQGEVYKEFHGEMGSADKLDVRVVSKADKPFYKRTEKVFEIETGLNDLQLVIDEYEKGEFFGQLINKAENEPISDAGIRILDTDSHWYKDVTVDKNGKFGPYDLPIGEYRIAVNSEQQLAIEQQDIMIEENKSVNKIIYAEKLQRYKVKIGEIRFRTYGEEWSSLSDVNRDLAWGYGFHVNVEGEFYRANKRSGRYGAYPLIIYAEPGDVLEACVNPREMTQQCQTLELGNEQEIAVDFEIDQQETALISGSVQLSNGNELQEVTTQLKQGRYSRDSVSGSTFQIPVEEPGEYSLVIDGKDSQGNSGTTVVPVTVEQDEWIDVGVVEISTEGIFAEGGGFSFSTTEPEVRPGGTVTYRASHGAASEDIENAVLLLDIPNDAQLNTDNVVKNGKQISPIVKDGTLEVPLGDITTYSGQHSIRYSLQLASSYDQEQVSADARIRYTVNGQEKTEVLGTASAKVSMVSINAPSQVEQNKITVYGIAPSNSLVHVHDNYQVIGSTRASTAGHWRVEVALNGDRSPSWHTLQANVDYNSETFMSGQIDVLYDKEQPKLEEVWVRQDFSDPNEWNGRGFPTSLINSLEENPEYTKISVGNAVPRIPMTGIVGVPVEVKLKFSNADKVSDVQIWLDGNNSNGIVRASRENDGMYYGRIQTYRGLDWDFGDLNINFDVENGYPKWADSIKPIGLSTITTSNNQNQEMNTLNTQNQSGPLEITHELTRVIEDWDDASISMESSFETGYSGSSSGTVTATTPNGFYDVSTEHTPGSHAFDYDWSFSGQRSTVEVESIIPLSEFIAADTYAPWWEDEAEVAVGNVQDDSVELSWNPAADDLWAQTYRIYQDGFEIGEVSASQLTYTVTGLSLGEDYTFQVEAIDPAGKSTMGPEIEIIMGETEGLSQSQLQIFTEQSMAMESDLSRTVRALSGTESVNAIKTANKIVGDGLNNGLGMIAWGDSLYSSNEDINQLNEMLDKIRNAIGQQCTSNSGAQNAMNEINEAKNSVYADFVIGTAGTAAGLYATASGVGAPAGAALTVASTIAGFATGSIRDDALAEAQEAYDELGSSMSDKCRDDFEDDNEDDRDDDDNNDNENRKNSRIDFAWKLDPSGFVYEVVEKNRIQGVTATVLYREDENNQFEVWDADWWGEVNPQTTGVFGEYGWDVPAGQWQVKYEKEGYETTFSNVLDVPPPHFDVNIPLLTTEAPRVEEITAYVDEGIEITFDQYMKTDTITVANYEILHPADSSPVEGTLSFVNPVPDTDGDIVTDTIMFTLEEEMLLGSQYNIVLRDLIQNYADIPMAEEYTTTVTVVEKPNEAPKISVNDQTIVVGDSFDSMAGVTATDTEDGDLTDSVTVTGTIDITVAGSYELTYEVTDSGGKSARETIKVTVEPAPNEAPEINASDQTITEGEYFDPLAGVTATDAEDGDLTSSVTVSGKVDTTSSGSYDLMYEVTDSGGKSTSVTITITVVELIPTPNNVPVISGENQTITLGDSFDPLAGVSATDEEDGDLTSFITVTGSVNTNVAASYQLVYKVTDSGGKTASKIITVTVKVAQSDDVGNDTEDPNTDDKLDIVITEPDVIDKKVTINDNDINLLNDEGQLIIDIRDNNSSVIVELTEQQVTILKDREAMIWIRKKDVEIQIPASVLINGEEAVEFFLERMEDIDLALSAVYDFTIYQGGEEISEFEEAITLIFEVDKDRVDDASSVLVYYWNPDTEEWEPFGGLYTDGSVTVTTKHFSTYAVFETMPNNYKDTNHPKIDEDNELADTATNTFNWIILGLLILIIGSVIWIVSIKRKKA